MDKSELLAVYDREQRIEVQFPGIERQVSERVIRHLFPMENSGYIAWSSLDDSAAEEEIRAQRDYFAGLGYWFEWKVYDHDKPADLRQRLTAHGFEVEEPEALMVLDMEHAPEFYWNMALPEIVRLTGAAGEPVTVDDVMRMEDEIWGTDHSDLGERLKDGQRSYPESQDIYAVVNGGRVASAAWTFYHQPTQFASLWGGSTLPEYRRRGYYTALLAIRARDAKQRGFRFLTVDASPNSRPILEKHGFQFLGYSTPCVWRPPKKDQQE